MVKAAGVGRVGCEKGYGLQSDASCGPQHIDLFIRKDTRADQKTNAFGVFEREHAATARNHIENELGMLPVFKLAAAHVKRRVAKRSDEDIVVAEKKLSAWITHRRAAVAASAGLVKHQLAMFAIQLRHKLDSGIGSENLIGNL